MAMKQTETKFFDSTDVGLDYSAGSKNLFPDRFKKMLVLGYNVQTVNSVSVMGDQITFTYGGAHGYAANRVLKVDSGPLSTINGGEFWIDAVTTNTVTFTLTDAPVSISGGFTTRIAPLGWELVYEVSNVHIYKFKALDESDLYLRLCFQNQAARRNCIAPCIGKSFDMGTGFITDPLSLAETRSVATPHDGFKWEFSFYARSTYDNYTYAQGASQFARGCIVGSAYHFVSMHSVASANTGRIVGFLPTGCLEYLALKYPMLIGESYAAITANASSYQGSNGRAFVGNVRVLLDQTPSNDNTLFAMPQATNSFTQQDTFNTTTTSPIALYEYGTRQFLGMVNGGLYACKYGTADAPVTDGTSPTITYDIDLNSVCPVHYFGTNSARVFLTAPVEEIKIA